LAVGVLAVSDVAAAPCEPRAALAGDAAAVARVTSELERLGVTVGKPAPGCAAIEAVVEQEGEGGIAVAIRAAGRSEGRVVSDPATAATWIDSWVRDDLDGGWLAPPSVTRRETPASVAAPAARASFLDRFTFAGGYEQVWTDDGSSWTGATLDACARFGPWCVGARVSARFQPSYTVNMATASREDLEALATASRAWELGRMVIAPEVGVGAGRMTTSRVDGCIDPNMNSGCMDPTDPTCKMPACSPDASGNSGVYIGDNLHAATITPRFAGALRIALPLFEHVWLDGLASVTFAPFGHRDAFAAGGNAINLTMNAPPGGPTPYDLPGEPRLGLQLGVGLRVGAP
jgi:hypothetical protein